MNRDELLLHAGVDHELDVAASLDLQERLSRDPEFAAAYASLRELRAGLREKAQRHRAPEALRERLMRAVAREPAPPNAATAATIPRAAARRTWLIASASALAGAVVAGGGVLLAWPPAWLGTDADTLRLAEDAVASHTRAALADRVIEVASSDQHTVRPWLSSHLSFAPPVPDLSLQGFELLGARRDLIDGQVVAALVYRRRLHVVSAFMRPMQGERAPQAGVVRGFNVITQTHGGMHEWIVSDLNRHELDDFAALMRAAN